MINKEGNIWQYDVLNALIYHNYSNKQVSITFSDMGITYNSGQGNFHQDKFFNKSDFGQHIIPLIQTGWGNCHLAWGNFPQGNF